MAEVGKAHTTKQIFSLTKKRLTCFVPLRGLGLQGSIGGGGGGGASMNMELVMVGTIRYRYSIYFRILGRNIGSSLL